MNWRRITLPMTLVGAWFLVSALGVFDPLLVPAPWEVVTFVLSSKQWPAIGTDLASSCIRLAVGFALGGCLGVLLGVAMGGSRRLYETLEFVVDFFRSIPIAALFPLFLVLFGIGNASKVLTTAWSTALVVLVHTMYGVRACSLTRQRFAQTLHATRSQVLISITIPEAMPSILAGLRTGLSIALIVVVLTEMFLGTSSGLGHRIFNAALLYETPEMYAMIALTGLLGYALNRGFVALESHVLRYAPNMQRRG